MNLFSGCQELVKRHTCPNVLIPFMQQKENRKILVLTPTNKAADVLVTRIMEVMGTDLSYENWLARFGTTNDETIEQSPVYRDKTFDIRRFRRNVTVTTIARFPYDFSCPTAKPGYTWRHCNGIT